LQATSRRERAFARQPQQRGGSTPGQPLPGDYLVRVRASHIVRDARLDPTSAIDQDFGWWFRRPRRPGSGSVLLDRPAYAAPGLIQISVFDPARAASNTVSVG